jgi:hypothetical protein
MDHKTAEQFVRHHLASILIVLFVFATGFLSAAGFLWQRYVQLEQRKVQLDREDLRLEKQKLELNKREFTIQQEEKFWNSQKELVEKKEKETSSALAKLQGEKQAVASQTRIKNAEALIDQRMAEFSALGIDLTKTPCGNDPDYTHRYNQAMAKSREISALLETYNLKAKYRSFFPDSSVAVDYAWCQGGDKALNAHSPTAPDTFSRNRLPSRTYRRTIVTLRCRV